MQPFLWTVLALQAARNSSPDRPIQVPPAMAALVGVVVKRDGPSAVPEVARVFSRNGSAADDL